VVGADESSVRTGAEVTALHEGKLVSCSYVMCREGKGEVER